MSSRQTRQTPLNSASKGGTLQANMQKRQKRQCSAQRSTFSHQRDKGGGSGNEYPHLPESLSDLCVPPCPLWSFSFVLGLKTPAGSAPAPTASPAGCTPAIPPSSPPRTTPRSAAPAPPAPPRPLAAHPAPRPASPARGRSLAAAATARQAYTAPLPPAPPAPAPAPSRPAPPAASRRTPGTDCSLDRGCAAPPSSARL